MTTAEHIVRRLCFAADGTFLVESTFATEAELAGIRPRQQPLPLFCQPRELPTETAGPLFQKGDTP